MNPLASKANLKDKEWNLQKHLPNSLRTPSDSLKWSNNPRTVFFEGY